MMNFGESLKKALKDEYDRGAKYQEMAKSHGVSYAYIHGLINGKDPCGGVSLDKLQRMLPHAELNLHPSPVSMQQQANGNTNSQISQTMGADAGLSRVKDYQLRLYQQLVDMDIPDDAKLKLMQLIKSTPTE